jgi:hypothetical protein
VETENNNIENSIPKKVPDQPVAYDANVNPLYINTNTSQFTLFPETSPKNISDNDIKKVSSNKTNELVNLMINNQETLLKKLDIIHRDLSLLKKGPKETLFCDENNIDIVKDACEVMKKDSESNLDNINNRDTNNVKKIISILTSKSEKKSISLNIEIENEIKNLLLKNLDIKEVGPSDLVNFGLMLALLKK